MDLVSKLLSLGQGAVPLLDIQRTLHTDCTSYRGFGVGPVSMYIMGFPYMSRSVYNEIHPQPA